MGAYECLMRTELVEPGHKTKILQTKYLQKVDKFESIHLRSTDVDKKW